MKYRLLLKPTNNLYKIYGTALQLQRSAQVKRINIVQNFLPGIGTLEIESTLMPDEIKQLNAEISEVDPI